MTPFATMICGAGIAGIEAALRLRHLAGDEVQITLVDPGESLVYRPLAVREPFALSGARRYPLDALAAVIGADLIRDGVDAVDAAERKVHLAGGDVHSYDALLLALGGREAAPYEHAHVFNDRNAGETFHGIVQDIEDGYVTSLVLIEPDGPTWPLPLYELALMTAERAYSMNATCEITFITARQRPLDTFGTGAAEAVQRLLTQAGVALHAGATARVMGARHVVVEPQGIDLRPQRVVTLPRIMGPELRGIAGVAPYGLLPVDDLCRVRDLDGRVFAAGDATDFAVKHGGISAQQADTAAAGIAQLAGAAEAPAPFEPVVRGMLLTGHKPLFIAAHRDGGRWHSEVHDEPPWPADEKVVAEELGPFLKKHDQAAPRP